MPNLTDLANLLNDAEFHRLSVVKSGSEWQANLQVEPGTNSFRVCHGSTPAEAIAALFEPVPVFTPPCPVALPPCPVPIV